eukprot:TRINITY_DN37_c0_g1_i1.p1 TRINITY_DN37_c0_g1~~TRINITY_DN37_c0_g1_i1.p1  ORF type:complete len:121 (-),score=13.40 TRINITY_DN37_c0_g1_i1:36-398(-)
MAYQQPGYAQPAYQQTTVHQPAPQTVVVHTQNGPAPDVSSAWVWAVISFFYCWIISIFAIMYAFNGNNAVSRGDYETANREIKRSIKMSKIGIIVGILLYIAIVVFYVIFYLVVLGVYYD